MKSSSMKSTDVRAIALAVGSLVLASAVVGLAKWEFKEIEIKDIGGLVMTVMLLPVVVYFIASGNLTELGAFGFAAKFAKTAKEPVSPEMISYDDTQIVGLRKLVAAQEIDQSRPGVMKMTIGRKVPYTPDDLNLYLDALSRLRSFKLVVFLDNDKQVVAYMEDWVFKEQVELHAEEFLDVINSDQKKGLEDYPGVAKKTISTNSTNIQALRAMREQNLETLVIVDEQKILRGVVERVQVLSSIMLSLAP